MEKIFDLAKDLGEELANHPIGKRYQDARTAMDADPAARQLIQDYEQAAVRVEQKGRQGRPIEPEEKRTLSDLQGKIARNESVKKWMEAQVEYLNLLRQINDLVMRDQQEPAAPEKK
jgi:cell fate (sporulation/competence/biofilm development) regulator YlbF (YheA/YmcA/DUF963 family)